jgi:hypothetical protein
MKKDSILRLLRQRYLNEIHNLVEYSGFYYRIGADWLMRRHCALRRVAPRCLRSLGLQTKSMVQFLTSAYLLPDYVAALETAEDSAIKCFAAVVVAAFCSWPRSAVHLLAALFLSKYNF